MNWSLVVLAVLVLLAAVVWAGWYRGLDHLEITDCTDPAARTEIEDALICFTPGVGVPT